MKDNFKLIEKMLNEMGIGEIPDSFKEVSAPKSILDFNHEAERFINEPVYYILNVHDIDINKHVLEILLSIHSNVGRIIVNTTLHDTDKSIVKLKNAIAAYNYMLSGDVDIPRYLLYCDINNKEISKIMFYKTTVVDYFTNKRIEMDTFDSVGELPILLPPNKFIYFVNNDVAREFKNTIQPFDFDKIRNGVDGVEIIPQYDIDALYLKWVNGDKLSTFERYSKVFNTTIKDKSNIDFAEKYMDGYKKERRIHNKGESDNSTYIFMVNNGVNVIIMITDNNYKGDKIIQIPYNDNVNSRLLALIIKYIPYIIKRGDIHIVACEGILSHVVDQLIAWILCITNRKVEKILYDLDMDLPVAEYLNRLVERGLDFIYEDTNVMNSIVNFLRDGDITPYTNLLLLIGRYIKEFDEPCDIMDLDPFSDSLTEEEKRLFANKCREDFNFFVEKIVLPLSKDKLKDFSFDYIEIDELKNKYNKDMILAMTDKIYDTTDIAMALLTSLWNTINGMMIYVASGNEEKNKSFRDKYDILKSALPEYLISNENNGVFNVLLNTVYRQVINYIADSRHKFFISGRKVVLPTFDNKTGLFIQASSMHIELPPPTKGNLFVSNEESEKHTIKPNEPKPPTLLLDTPIRDLKDILETGVYILGVDKSVHKDNLPLVKWINSPISVYKNANCLSVYDGEELIHTV